MEREIQRLTWSKIKRLVPRQTDTVLLPLGTVEAHGAAALGTDNLIPEAIAGMQAERINALIAPTLNFGITHSLYQYPGSITIQPKNYVPFVIDVLNSLVDSKFRQIFILNGHGGNNSALKEAAYSVHYNRRAYIAVIHWWNIASELTKEQFGQVGGHAGLDETACVLAIDPALVDENEYTEKMAFLKHAGAEIYPSPGSVILYTEGEGYPNFNPEQARSYLPKMADAVGDYILKIIDQWRQIED